jgi:hypothetical protein
MMVRRVLRGLVLPIAAAATPAVLSLSPPMHAQTSHSASARTEHLPGAEVARIFVSSITAKDWVAPKTPWGDPDLQGNFTTKDEANTPYERPKVFEGKRIADVTPEELAEEVVARQKAHLEAALIVDQGSPRHFRDSLEAQNSRPWFVIDPPDGKIPPMTAEGRARIKPREVRDDVGKADSYADRSLSDRCITRGVPSMSPGIYGNSFQILQTPGYVAIRYEMIHETRLIPLGVQPDTSVSTRFYNGDARGHWEGNTLVVVTTNFDERVDFRGASAKNLRMIERFTRTASKKVEWTVTIDDPTTWSRPWTFSIPLTEDDTQAILEYACHEGNYGLANILSAARARDRQSSHEAREVQNPASAARER